MPMEQIQLTIPKGLVSFFQVRNSHDELVRNAMMLYPYIQRKIISHGKAAELLGIHKFDLIELYGEMGIPYLDFDISRAEAEAEAYERILEKEAAVQ